MDLNENNNLENTKKLPEEVLFSGEPAEETRSSQMPGPAPERFRSEVKPHVVANRAQRKGAPVKTGHARTKKRRGLDKRSLIILLAVFALIILFVFVIGTKKDEKTGKTVTIAQYVAGEFAQKTVFGEPEVRLSEDMEPIAVDEESPFYEQFRSADRVNVLLLGINANMTDTIMLGSYDMKNQKVDIISIPRDTYYYRAGYEDYSAWQKLNSYYHSEGVTSRARACSDLLCGMPIHYYVIVEYSDIRAVMKELGGVKINIPFYMKYDDTTPGYEFHVDIPAGEQLIDETNVIQFLRFRHTNPYYAAQGYKSYAQGDIQRIQVQQDFVKTVIKAVFERGKVLDVLQVVLDNVDSDLTYGTALQVATKALSGFSMENIDAYTLPGIDFVNTLSFWRADKEQTEEMLAQIYGVEIAEEDPEEPVIIEPGSRIRFVGIPAFEEVGE